MICYFKSDYVGARWALPQNIWFSCQWCGALGPRGGRRFHCLLMFFILGFVSFWVGRLCFYSVGGGRKQLVTYSHWTCVIFSFSLGVRSASDGQITDQAGKLFPIF